MGTICWQIGSHHRHETVRSVGAAQGAPEKVRLRAGPGGNGCEGIARKEIARTSTTRLQQTRPAAKKKLAKRCYDLRKNLLGSLSWSDLRLMKTHLAIVILLMSMAITVCAGDVQAPLTQGDYILVYGSGLTELKVSFSKGSDGKLALSCPEAPSSPSAMLQQDGLFQFSIVYTSAKESSVRCLVFVGYGVKDEGTGKEFFRGSFAQVEAVSSPRSRSQSAVRAQGNFLLHKVANIP
jgi:hypothetical protein